MSILKTLTINGTRYNVTPVVPTDAVTLYASAWEGNGDVYSQVVNVPGVTPKTKVDLQPTSKQLVDFHDKILAFVAENDGGTVTVYSIADKPTGDHTIQITKTEVAGAGKIRGNTVGTTMPSVLYTEQHLTPEQKAVARKNIGSGVVVCLTAEEAEEAPDGSLWVVHPAESKPKGISLYYEGENEADLKNAPNGSVWLAHKSSNKPATPEGGITEETDPTVPDWAKQPQKPTYTAAEVGAATPDDITKALANLPTGGSNKWEFIGEFNVGKADVAEWIVDKYADGTPISLKQMYFEIDFKASPLTTASTKVLLGNPASENPFRTNCAYASLDLISTSGKKSNSGEGYHVMCLPNGDENFYTACLRQTSTYTAAWQIGRSSSGGKVLRQCVGGIAFESANASTGLIGANSTVKIWGVKI